ncbi:TonB-dependent receptor plug domain-containing protein [Duncaniella freteri]|uniref:TonB-dependent receptor plug domain-containing protein n=1 Tax=Duncaniella freteri TaxID=2530391 RepID=UPI002577ED70|nr:TonB-dependent receptor plug domain-containing protein [Duncaniella freteri]
MRKRLLSILLTLMLVPMAALARNYSVTFNDTSAEETLAMLHKVTGYDFVYQKELLNGITVKVNGKYNDMSLEQLLNRTVDMQMGLEYRIVDKVVSLSKPSDGEKFFKSVISGIVVDDNNDPLIGATVRLNGTDIVTTTDVDGAFSIIAEGKRPTLEVTYVGMKAASVRLNPDKEKFIMVKMDFDPTLMNEVVVTGYQTLKRENATGAYQTISSADIDRSFTGTVTDRLEGKVPGLVTYNNGDGQKMTIRGLGSFHASTQPLVVVDGLPIEGGIETVNAYDIENITVLKDAAAASIYGARAANGVIVISTKRAHSDKVTIDFNTDITITEKNNYDNYG